MMTRLSHHARVRRIGAVWAVALATLAACAGQPAPTTQPTPAAVATTAPTSPPPSAASPAASAPVSLKVSFNGSPPAGWTVDGGDGVLSFNFEEGDAWMSVDVLPNRAVMDGGCELKPQDGVGTSASAIGDAIATRPGVAVTGRKSVAVAGLTGQQIDLHVDSAKGVSCPKDAPEFVPLVGFGGPRGWEFIGVGADDAARLLVLDAPGGQNVVVAVFAPAGAVFDDHIAEASSILEKVAIGS
jgi:hypothetical protein